MHTHMKNQMRVTSLLLLSSNLLFTGASLADRLIYYPFDVENGVEVENRGTLTNGVLAGGATYGASRNLSFGTAFYGNRTGANDGYVLTQLSGNDLGFGATGVYTAMAWVNWAGTSDGSVDHMVFGQDDGAGNNNQLHHGIRDDSAANIHFGGWGGAQDTSDAGTVAPNEWTHVAWQYDGTDKVVYVDGVETSREAGNNITDPSFNLIIGAHGRDSNLDPAPGMSFNGAIDEVKIFNEVLTAAQITVEMVPAEDTDNDGISDVDEINIYNTDPNDDDSDDDSLKDGAEVLNMMDPNSGVGDDGPDGDPDGDTLSNRDEIEVHFTNPQSDDSDSDDLKDQDEISIHMTNPNRADSDTDGLSDSDEINTHATDANDADSDDDGLSDGDEINTHMTDPNDSDSDDDTFSDSLEIQVGSDPNDSDIFPSAALPEPLLYYSFDVDDGTSVENIGSLATEGTTSGGVTYGDSKDGSFGTAFVGNRDGDNDALIQTGFTGDDLGFGATEVYTAMAWMNWSGSSGHVDHMIFGQDDGAGNQAQLHHGIRDDSEANIHFGGWGGAQDISDAGIVPAETWTHVVWQYDGADKVVYVNGVETSRVAGNNITDPTFNIIIGGHGRDSNLDPAPGNSFNGSIDEVRIYGEALNPVQIAEAMIPNPSSGPKGLEVTEISVNKVAETVTLTFRSRPGRTYSLLSSLSLDDGPDFEEIDDSVTADPVEKFTTITFPTPAPNGSVPGKIFFFVKENP